MQDGILTREEVMKRLRIGKTAFNNLVNGDPDFKTIKVGPGRQGRRVMREAALLKWLEKKENEGA